MTLGSKMKGEVLKVPRLARCTELDDNGPVCVALFVVLQGLHVGGVCRVVGQVVETAGEATWQPLPVDAVARFVVEDVDGPVAPTHAGGPGWVPRAWQEHVA